MIVYFFSNQTGAESSKVSDKVTRKLLKVKDTLSIVIENYEENNEIIIRGIETNPVTNERVDKWKFKVRKLAHYTLFTIGGFLIFCVLCAFNLKFKVLISIFIGFIFACIDEIHQIYSVNRGPQIRDVFIDTAGVITGVIIAFIIVTLLSKILSFIFKYCKKGKTV